MLDPEYKNRLNRINDEIITNRSFENFEANFDSVERLLRLVPMTLAEPDKLDLKKLYSYKSSAIQKLKLELTTDSDNRKFSTCQNCTINDVNSMDHFLPKSRFHEFIVNPKNLIPSCTECNSHKSDRHYSEFLNLYLDSLPQVQFLFVRIDLEGDLLVPNFFLENRNSIPESFFQRILNHFSHLHLLDRFAQRSVETIVKKQNLVESLILKMTREDITESVVSQARRNMQVFGANFWESVLEIELVNSSEFWDRW